jgi:hypothetical protein
MAPSSSLSFGLCLVVALLGASHAEKSQMTNAKQLKTAEEIRLSAGKVASAVLPDEIAETLPVPKRTSGQLAVQILYYRESGRPGNRRVQAPEHCMLLDAESGKLIRFWACTAEELGIDRQSPVVAGAGVRPGMTAEEYSAREDRLLAISQPIWSAFFTGQTSEDSATRALAREYRQLFLESTKAEVAHFVVGAAGEFFKWLEATAQ